MHSTLDRWMTLLVAAVFAAGCAGTLDSTEFTNPRFDFGFVERVAVMPFENLTNDREAGFRATRLMATELLSSGAVDVVEAGEVQAALGNLPGGLYGRIARPSTEQIVALGRELGVQAVVLGTVTQSEVLRTGQVGWPVVTLDSHLVEVETGSAVWAATHTEKGSSFSAKLLGTAGEPLSDTTRRCIRALLGTLLE